PRFATAGLRVQHLKDLEAELTPRFRQKSSEHWLAALERQGVPCGPVRDMLQALSDPHTIAREMVVEVPHATLGTVQTLGVPVKFSRTPAKISHGAPVYGQHSREVLRDYGFGSDEIATLEKDGALISAAQAP
ncbi:MAG: CoA transferase, partial [Pseudolabrys sp.]|nr:CoA transferase [Pseudolabrys sp.]